MSLRDPPLKKAYSSDNNDILHDFYIPVLREAIEYNRLAGFFSSTSLAIAAKGVIGLIKNRGKMRLVASPRLDKKDLEAIREARSNPEKYIEKKMLKELENLENEFIRDHVFALAWMVANQKLDIKVAIAYDNKGNPLSFEDIQQSGLFHQKVGIIKDQYGNMVSFSGSINETAAGWIGNIEEFKVFRSWNETEKEYLNEDILKFERYWKNESKRVQTIDIPYALKRKLIEIAPSTIEEINLEKWYKRLSGKKIELFDHQKKAINSWLANKMRGIFEMATGTGKTYAALGCLQRLMEKEKRLVTVIVCPYNHLITQWIKDIEKFGISCKCIVADSSNPRWKDDLADSLLQLKSEIQDQLVVLTTHATFSTPDFIKIIRIANENLFLIVDEVHGIGAPKRREGLIEDYKFRLGLSATPKRWFDTEGTKTIFDYFGDTVFEFPLKKAINTVNPSTGETYLTPYEYKPFFVKLTDNEFQKYIAETEKIAKLYYSSKNEEEKEKWFTLLCIKRQKIIVNAINKYTAFKKILDELGEKISHCVVYCSEEQIDRVRKILAQKNINYHSFTMEEGVKPEKKYGGISERDFLLQKFNEGVYQVLVAIKCLDEGVDIPPAKIGVILASSGNPRQYIQRRGRLLRRFPRKKKAIIYDILVLPPTLVDMPTYLIHLERKILSKELKRYREFADASLNSLECLNKIYNIEKKFGI